MAVIERNRYVPQGYVLAVADEALGLEVFVDAVRNCALGFAGRRNKSDFNYRFKNAERMNEYIAEYVEGIKAAVERKAQRKSERVAAIRNAVVNVGDIFRASWGYDQTNIDYFEVVGVKGQMIEVREIGQMSEEDGFMSGKCVPVPGAYRGEVMRKKINAYGDTVCFKLYSFANAYLEKPVAVIAGKKIFQEANWTAYA